MYECLIIFIFSVTLLPFSIGCSKKQKNKGKATTPTENEKLQDQKRKEVAAAAPAAPAPSGTAEVDKKKIPKPNEPNMPARDANDNETINDAKSDWGELPA